MSNVINIAEEQSLELEAATWVTKLDGKRLEANEFAQFKAWLNMSDEHAAAFDRAAATWGNLEILAELRDEVPVPAPSTSFWTRLKDTITVPVRSPAYALAATILVVMVGFTAMQPQDTTPSAATIFATAIGENKTIDLADGSQVILNTGSQVEVSFDKKRRLLKLLKGEAHFDVAHNPDRPFEVHAGTNIVRAVGTAFTVELKQETVEVTVTEGRVELATVAEADASTAEPQETSLALINSGQSAQFSDYVQSIDTIAEEEVARRLAWQRGALVFEGDALEDVIQEVSRYTKTRIVISDPSIRNLKVGGYFKTSETEAMLHALEANFGIAVEWVGPDLVYLSQSAAE